uniref:Sema domain-containing protein n=1 Tax=Tetranychus urticae TaxID=32264 RepID=T1KDY5_TETUR
MITLFYRNTLLFIFLVKMTVSSKYFKQYRLASHKVHHQVFPSEAYDGSYTVYVAGEVFTIKVPAIVEDDPHKIVKWKVMNSNPNRLIYISGTEAYIMIDQLNKTKLDYPGSIQHSIIVLGNNEALYIPTFDHSSTLIPIINRNYFALLYADEKEEKIKIVESIKWLAPSDKVYIGEWSMLDHITIGTKLYILLKRTLNNIIKYGEQFSSHNEIFITRLSLSVGERFLESAVELNIRVSFAIYQAQFLMIFDGSEKQRLSILVRGENSIGEAVLFRGFLPKFDNRFDTVVRSCKTINVCKQMHLHLRSGSADCYSKGNCPFNEKLYPTGALELPLQNFDQIPVNATLRTFNAGHVDAYYNFVYFYQEKMFYCRLKQTSTLNCNQKILLYGFAHIADPILNVVSGKTFLLAGSGSATNVSNIDPYPCFEYYNCADCIMYGLTFGCIWTNMTCKQLLPDQEFNIYLYTVNHCLTIVSFSLDYLRQAVNILKIEFEKTFKIKNRIEEISISVGLDDCVNINLGDSSLTCELHLRTSGNFTLVVYLSNDAYLDSTTIMAIASERIEINESNGDLSILFALLLFGIVVVAIFVIYLVIINIPYHQPTILPRLGETTRTFRSRLSDYLGSTLGSQGASFGSKTLTELTFDRQRKKKLKANKK